MAFPEMKKGDRPMNIVIVGGSLAGLFNGIMLKRLGHNVHILEADPSNVRTSEAAGIRAGPEAQAWMKRFDLTKAPYSIPCPGLNFINRESQDVKFVTFPMTMTGWSTLYYRLRANFDGFTSKYVAEAPASLAGDGHALYDLGKSVNSVVYEGGKITLDYSDTINKTTGSLVADFVIAADGSRSAVRSMLMPELQRPYAGYVALRGSVVEKDVTPETRRLLKDNFTVFKMPRNYILVYTIPGKAGTLEEGSRLLNFVWYYNVANDSEEFASLMTDKDGHKHRHTLPPGGMDPVVWERQKAYARSVLAPPFIELVEKTPQPFISSVSDALCTKATFFDGRLLLVGDALALFRPHIALSGNQAAMNSILLEKVFKGEMPLKEWETRVLQYGAQTRRLSIMIGSFSQFGGLPLVKSAAQYGMTWAYNTTQWGLYKVMG